MFGIDRKTLIENLEKVRSTLCCYMGDRCDCKYGPELTDLTIFPAMAVGSEGTGCPEVRSAIEILAIMTDEEYEALCIRARVILPEQLVNAINGTS